MLATGRTQHASAVLVGARAVLVRGPSGAGKSRLVLDLLSAAEAGQIPFARLVGDDRVILAAANGRVLVSPAPPLAGLIELRGLGLLRRPHEPLARVGLVVDLGAPDADRLPQPDAMTTEVCGVSLPRLPLASREGAQLLVIARLRGDVA